MQLPGPLRAYIGLLATAADEAKRLPDRAIEFPMLAVSTALQMSLRAQQRYAQLAARGDEVLNHRSTTDEPPPWATFDEPVEDTLVAEPSVDDVDEPVDLVVVEEVVEAPARPARKRPKKVNPPRNAPSSRFDAVGDDDASTDD